MCSMTCFTWSLVFNRRSIWAHLTIFGDTMCTWRYNCANMEHQVFLWLVAAPACVTPSKHPESEIPTLFVVFFPCTLSHKCFAATLSVYSFVSMVMLIWDEKFQHPAGPGFCQFCAWHWSTRWWWTGDSNEFTPLHIQCGNKCPLASKIIQTESF